MSLQYCDVVDGTIANGPRALLRSWRNISGLKLHPANKLAALGWFPVEDSKATLDASTAERTAPVLTVVPIDKAIRTIGKRFLPPQEIRDRRDNQDSDQLRDAVKDIIPTTVGIAEALIANGVLVPTDVEASVWQACVWVKKLTDKYVANTRRFWESIDAANQRHARMEGRRGYDG